MVKTTFCLAVAHLDDDQVGLVAAHAPPRVLLPMLPPAAAGRRGGGGGGGEHSHLVAPPPLPADGHRTAEGEEVGELGQRQEAEAGAEADEAAEGGCFGIGSRETPSSFALFSHLTENVLPRE